MPCVSGDDLDSRLLRLSPEDNVAVAKRAIEAGATLMIAGRGVAVPVAIPLGHKVALRAIAVGEKAIKYGAPIGSAAAAIAPGDHVHIHNLKSDYLPSFGVEDP